MFKVYQISYVTNDKVQREKFILTARTIRPAEETIPVYEITEGVLAEKAKDAKNGSEPFPGRSAAHYLYLAALSFAQHRRVLLQWKDSASARDASYVAYLSHLMHAAPKSTMISEHGRSDHSKDNNVEFYPKIGFPGDWRTLKNDRITVIRTFDFSDYITELMGEAA